MSIILHRKLMLFSHCNVGNNIPFPLEEKIAEKKPPGSHVNG